MALSEFKKHFKFDGYPDNIVAVGAYYQELLAFVQWYEINYKQAKKIKTVDELLAAAGITF